MAWVHRTTRENNRVGYKPGNTPAHVGPGSYTQPSAFKKRRNPSFAPFQSTADRSGGVTTEVTAHYTPGPGAYVVEGANRKHQGHHAASTPFLSLQERFRPPPTKDTPGPGAYTAPSTFRRKRGGGGGGSPKKKAGGGAHGSSVDAPAVTWVRVPTAPSIPAASQSYGYEEGQYGELTMQKAPNRGHTGRGADTAGPGSYNPNDRVLAGRRRVAVDFGRSKSRRTDFAKSEVPGPGEYTKSLVGDGGSHVPRPGTWVRDRSKPSSTFASRVGRDGPRPHHRVNVPGPGAYGVGSSFRKQTVPERQQFFGSTSRRFKPRRSRSAGPGPGSYDAAAPIARASRLATTGGGGARGRSGPPHAAHVGFASTSARFGFSKPSSEKPTPGAGAYNTPGMVDMMKQKPVRRSVCVRVFDLVVELRCKQEWGGAYQCSCAHVWRGVVALSVGVCPSPSGGSKRSVWVNVEAVLHTGVSPSTRAWRV